MQGIIARARTNALPLAVVILGLFSSLALAFASFDFLISNLLPDDSFYYFEIARNIVHGLGSTFDGVNLTNGYHPLWLLILLPIFHFFSTGIFPDLAPIRAVLVLAALLNAGVGLVLLSIFSRYTQNAWIKAAALSVWFFNPYNLYEMMSGLETPLSLLFISLFMLAGMRASERDSRGRLIVAGIVGGFMMLARLDNLLYFVVYLAWLWYRYGRHDFRGSIRPVLTVGLSATVVVAPWLVWNYATFGMLFTSSSLATTLVNHQLIIQDHGTSILQTIKAAIYSSDFFIRWVATQTGAPSVFFGLGGLAIGWICLRATGVRSWLLTQVPVEWFLLLGLALNFIVNATIRWSARTWYFIPFNLFLALGIAWLMEVLRREDKLRTDIAIAAALIVAYLFFVSWSKDLKDRSASQREILSSVEWMNQNLPQGAVVGAFNAGIQGYLSTHRVVNLDGLVNDNAYQALRQKDLWAYVESAHISYLADFPEYFTYRFKSFEGSPDILANATLLQSAGADGSGLDIYQLHY